MDSPEYLSYELLKKLKHAGFPFVKPFEGAEISFPTTEDVVSVMGQDYVRFDAEWYLIPQLSGIIKACGRRFDRIGINYATGGWRAFSINEKYADGATPEEAAAKLFLVRLLF